MTERLPLTVLLPPSERQHINQVSNATGVSPSEIAGGLITAGLKSLRTKAAEDSIMRKETISRLRTAISRKARQ